MTVHFWEIKNHKKMGRPRKLEKKVWQRTLKLPVNMFITYFHIAESKF